MEEIRQSCLRACIKSGGCSRNYTRRCSNLSEYYDSARATARSRGSVSTSGITGKTVQEGDGQPNQRCQQAKNPHTGSSGGRLTNSFFHVAHVLLSGRSPKFSRLKTIFICAINCKIAVLPKSILDVSYQDIEQLMEEEEKESEVLDYKVGLVSDDSLFKHVCAFANTRGGDLIFGIKESGGGGHPVAIMGVDNDKIDREQIEDKILSNIEPRVHVAIKQIPIPDKPKPVLVIRVPSSKERPHCVKDRGYYKRFTFKSAPMTEQEVAGLYKKRFYNHEQVNQYWAEPS